MKFRRVTVNYTIIRVNIQKYVYSDDEFRFTVIVKYDEHYLDC